MEIFLTILAILGTAGVITGVYFLIGGYFFDGGYAPRFIQKRPIKRVIPALILTVTVLPVGLMLIKGTGKADISTDIGEYFYGISDKFENFFGKRLYDILGNIFAMPHKYPRLGFAIRFGRVSWDSASYFLGAAVLLVYFIVLIVLVGNVGELNYSDACTQKYYDKENASMPKQYVTKTTTTFKSSIWNPDTVKATTTSETKDVTPYKYVVPWWLIAFPCVAAAVFLVPVATLAICMYYTITTLVVSCKK